MFSRVPDRFLAAQYDRHQADQDGTLESNPAEGAPGGSPGRGGCGRRGVGGAGGGGCVDSLYYTYVLNRVPAYFFREKAPSQHSSDVSSDSEELPLPVAWPSAPESQAEFTGEACELQSDVIRHGVASASQSNVIRRSMTSASQSNVIRHGVTSTSHQPETGLLRDGEQGAGWGRGEGGTTTITDSYHLTGGERDGWAYTRNTYPDSGGGGGGGVGVLNGSDVFVDFLPPDEDRLSSSSSDSGCSTERVVFPYRVRLAPNESLV